MVWWDAGAYGHGAEDLDALLASLARMAHPDRMRTMAGFGRLAGSDDAEGEKRRATVAALERGGFFQRLMALQSCCGSLDGAHVLRAMSDPSRNIRSMAASFAPWICDDRQLLEALRVCPRQLRAGTLRNIMRRRRRAVADRFLVELAEGGDPDFEALLPFGSEALVRARLQDFASGAGYDAWARLGRFHPQIAAAHLAGEERRDGMLDQRWAFQTAWALPSIARQLPDLALGLAAALSRLGLLGSVRLTKLAEIRPDEMADLLLAQPAGSRAPPGVLDRLAARLGNHPSRLSALVSRYWELGRDARQAPTWLRRLQPQARLVAYGSAALSWRDRDGALAPDLVELLPRAEREAEARRNWGLSIHVTRPRAQMRYASLLPYDEAAGLLKSYLGDPEPGLRAAALAALVSAVRFTRDRIDVLLALVEARGNEQDPVRLAMLGELARLPPSIFDNAALARLGVILRQSLSAADLSGATAAALERLLLRLIPTQPGWAVPAFALLMGERGTIATDRLDRFLSDGDMARLAPALWPILQGWTAREREGEIVALAARLGPRLAAWSDLLGLLEQLVSSSRHQTVAAQALALIARHRRDRFAALVPALLQEDPSWITQRPVQAHLHARRQDLLRPYLGRTAFVGRFSTGKTRYVMPFRTGFERWLPVQQETFAQALIDVSYDADRDMPGVLGAIDALAALPDVEPESLRALSALDNPRPASRERALRALARRDNGDGVDLLVTALGDERARIAVYTLRVALRGLPRDRVLAILGSAPRTRVTVFKEIVRLAGEIGGDASFRFLLEIARGGDARSVHRDVRLALLRAFHDHLEHDETWQVLGEAAASSDPAVATAVVRIPADRLSDRSADRLATILAALLVHPAPNVRLSVLNHVATLPIPDRSERLSPALLIAVGSDLLDEAAAAVTALLATKAGRQPERLAEAVGHALPNRRALAAFVSALVRWLPAQAGHAALAHAALAALAADELTGSLRSEIALGCLPTRDLVAFLADFGERGRLHAGVLATVVSGLEAGRCRNPEAAEAVAAAFAGSHDERLRRISLAALVGLGRAGSGWTEVRLAALDLWRTDSSPLVAEAAQFTFVH